MRKLFFILSIIFTVLSVVFSVLPFDTLAFLPIVLALLFLGLSFVKSAINERTWTKRLFMITYICAAIVIFKTFFLKDEIAVDTTFEQQKIETKQEAKKELEEIEGLE